MTTCLNSRKSASVAVFRARNSHGPLAIVAAVLPLLMLSACGGGSPPDTATSGADVSTQNRDALATVKIQAAHDGAEIQATSAAPAAPAASTMLDDASLLAAAMAASTTGGVPSSEGPEAQPKWPLVMSTASTAKSLSVRTSVAATPYAATVPGRVFYVNSGTGSDANDGQSNTSAAAGKGPWRTLAKLAAVTLQPGDTVQLACGSAWNETLRVANSGSPTSPITLAAYPAGCTSPPVIDGGASIRPSAWKQHSGNIYKTSLVTVPLQLHASAGTLTAAHHPNLGFDATQPQSLFLKVAADADKITINGRIVSTSLTTGADLQLPAGATLRPGNTVRIRTNSWFMEESTISTVSGNKLTLAATTNYAVTAGWGYYLLGSLWMLDSAGEWYYDATSKTLYVWMPDSRAPSSAVLADTLATGIDLASRQYITVNGLTVRRVGTGMNAQHSTGVALLNSRIEDTAGIGIDAAGSIDATVSTTTLLRTGRDAISGVSYSVGISTGMQVINNTISDSGVTMSGETLLSLPVGNNAAVRAGTNGTVTGNTITNAGYDGIWAWPSSTIANNVISGACTTLDDCGAIYASGANNNSLITGNVVLHSRGAMAGKGSQFNVTQAQGIYLDESASGITVSGNTATDNDYGIQLHVAAKNTVTGNKLYGNRSGQLWMQETRRTDYPAGDVNGNIVTANQIVTTSGTAKAIWLDTQFADTVHFGTFDGNRYFDRLFATIVDERTATSSTSFTLPKWRSAIATTTSAPRNNETTGWGASQILFAPSQITGSNIVPNGDLKVNSLGWSVWNQIAPFGSLAREACIAGMCAHYYTGASAGILISPNFSVVAGSWYRLSVDVAAAASAQTIDMVVRRGGGGTNGYESLSDRSLKFYADSTMTRYSVFFKATKSVNAKDPLTGDNGARVDFQNVEPGKSLSVSNLELVQVSIADATNRSDLLLNTGGTAMQATCPLASTQPSMCANYFRLSDNQPVVWPYTLPARGSEIVYTRDPRLVDSDGDGIPDSQDSCPGTPAGMAVNSRGCMLGQ